MPSKKVDLTSSENLRERLQNYRLDKILTDIILTVGKREFSAHRIVLQDATPFLKALLSDNWSQGNVYELSEQFVDCQIMEDLLTYFYTAKITITNENARTIYMASHYLDIGPLLSICEEFIFKEIFSTNVLNLLLFATTYQLDYRIKKCLTFLMKHFEIVFPEEKILNITLEEFALIIEQFGKQNINWYVKEKLLESIIKWLENNLPHGSSMPVMLENIPFEQLSLKFLNGFLSTKSIIYGSKQCFTLLNAAIEKALPENSKAFNSSQLLCFAGVEDRSLFQTAISKVDMSTGKWKILTGLSCNLANFCGAVIGTKIYLYGVLIRYTENGPAYFEERNILEVFDIKENVQTSISNCPNVYGRAAAVAMNEFIYVTGGEYRDNRPLPFFRYCTRTGNWQEMAPMKNNKFQYQLVELNGYIYAIGRDSSIFERYDPQNNEWKSMANQDESYACFSSATAFGGKIYLLKFKFLEVYSPDEDSWRILATFPDTSPNIYDVRSLVSIDNKLCLVGSWNGEKKAICEFDFSTGRWNKIAEMDFTRACHRSFVIQH